MDPVEQQLDIILLRAMVDSAQDAIIVMSPEGKIIFWNKSAERVFGYSKNEAMGAMVHSLLARPEEHARFNKAYPLFYKEGKGPVVEHVVELTALRKGRVEFPIELSISAVLINDGWYAVAIIRDISERKEETKKIAASEHRYRRLFEAARDGILILDAETGDIVDVNPFMIELLGFTYEEFLTKKVWELGFLKEKWANKEQFSELQKVGYVRYEDLPLERIDGNKAHVEFVSNVYEVDGKNVIQCNIRDITERKMMETVLEVGKLELVKLNKELANDKEIAVENNIKDEALLASLSEGMITTDKNGLVTAINKAAEDMLGWAADELVGKNFVDTVQAVDENGDVVARGNRPANMVFNIPVEDSLISVASPILSSLYYVKKSGEKIPVTTAVTPIIIKREVIGAMETFRDTTQEKEVEKTRGDLLALASHQLRTPLSGTKWLIETLQSGLKGDFNKEQKEYLGEIYKINEQMTTLVGDMLGVLRMESGAMPVHKVFISSSKLLDNLFQTFDPAAKSKNQTLIVERGVDYALETDPLLLRNVLESLVSNALMYSNLGGEIKVNLEKVSDNVMFTIKDSGIGIPKDEQEHLFQRFYRASNAKTFNTHGTGLGLYIADTLAKKIGAKITLESEEGKGSTFSVSLPISCTVCE